MYTVLKKLRKAKGLTQKKIAEKLCIDVSTYAKIEQGKNRLVDTYYDALSEVLGVNRADLFELYCSENDLLPEKKSVPMRLIVANNIKFGHVEILKPFCQSSQTYYDSFSFKLKKTTAAPIIKDIDSFYRIMNEISKKIQPGSEDVLRADYIEDKDNPNFIIFTAQLLFDIEVNGRKLNSTEASKVLAEIDVATIEVTCSIIVEYKESKVFYRLILQSVNVDTQTDIFVVLPEKQKFALIDMHPEMLVEFLCNQNEYRSIDEIINLGKKYNWECSEDYAKWLFKACVLKDIK